MKRKSLKIVPCCQCGESDYADYLNTIDGRLYCQACADELDNEIIELVDIDKP